MTGINFHFIAIQGGKKNRVGSLVWVSENGILDCRRRLDYDFRDLNIACLTSMNSANIITTYCRIMVEMYKSS